MDEGRCVIAQWVAVSCCRVCAICSVWQRRAVLRALFRYLPCVLVVRVSVVRQAKQAFCVG